MTETDTAVEEQTVPVRAPVPVTVVHAGQQTAIDLALTGCIEQTYNSAHLYWFSIAGRDVTAG